MNYEKKIKELKQLKLHKDLLINKALDIDLLINKLTDELQQARMKQSKVAYEIEQANKKVFDIIGEI